MRGSGEDVVDPAQLLEMAQPLELGRIDDLHAQRVQRDVPVDRVVDHLQPHRLVIVIRLASSANLHRYTIRYLRSVLYITVHRLSIHSIKATPTIMPVARIIEGIPGCIEMRSSNPPVCRPLH
jgi:hypothetical protein